MLPAEQIQPYVNLLTWQVVALLGGAFLSPALYLLVSRISEIDAFGVTLRQREANIIVKDAEEEVQEEIDAGASPVQVLADASAEEGAESPRERVRAAMQVWSAVAYIIRDLAIANGSSLQNASQTREQIAFLREKDVITLAQHDRAIELLRKRNDWKAHASRPISPDEFRSFRRRSRTLGTNLSALLNRTPHTPSPSPPRSPNSDDPGATLH